MALAGDEASRGPVRQPFEGSLHLREQSPRRCCQGVRNGVFGNRRKRAARRLVFAAERCSVC